MFQLTEDSGQWTDTDKDDTQSSIDDRVLSAVYCLPPLLLIAIQDQLPIADIHPPIQLKSDFLELSHFDKTEFLAKGDARRIRQGNAGKHAVDLPRPKLINESGFELRAHTPAQFA